MSNGSTMAAGGVAERQLIARCRLGDRAAFGPLVDGYKPQILALCARLVGNLEDAKDLAQETFLRAFLGLERFRQDAQFSTWLHRIAINLCLNALARKGPSLRTLDDSFPDQNLTPESLLLRRERGRRVQHALDTLSAELRVAVVLRDGLGFSYAEIGECLGIPLGTVKSRINAARWALRGLLEEFDDL
jgi:RNA polymerase sigma-70 factor, ECF subfamily